jgi:hypothetical protein
MVDDQSSSQNTKGSTQETSDQGTSISFDFESAVREFAQPKPMASLATATTMNVWDLAGGRKYDESSQNFTSKYEAIADARGWNLQMMHY